MTTFNLEETNQIPFATFTQERPQSPDVLLGAYLVSHLTQRCENCGEMKTPQWRKGWYSNILQRTVLLCNACGLKYSKQQFCPYCMYVYYKEEDKKNQKDTWINCSKCSRWVHLFCEQQYGGRSSFQFNLNSPNLHKSYVCPVCRNSSNATNPHEQLDHDEPTFNRYPESSGMILSSSPPEHQVPSFLLDRMQD